MVVGFFSLIPFFLGLVQGGEFVTARATAMVKGTFQHSSPRTIPQLAVRELEGFQIE